MEDLDEQLKEIERLMEECKELENQRENKRENQRENKRGNQKVLTSKDIQKIMCVIFFLQVYVCILDPELIVVRELDKLLNEAYEINKKMKEKAETESETWELDSVD